MKLNIKFMENEMVFNNEYINVLEIENRHRFFNTVLLFNNLQNGSPVNNCVFYNKDYNELILMNKVCVISDYFNIELNSRKMLSRLNKYIIDNITEGAHDDLIKAYSKIIRHFNHILKSIELDLDFNSELNIEKMLSVLNININKKNSILENLLVLIDIEKIFKLNYLLVFVNLKQYLSIEEIHELYKYSLYNNVNILLLDSQSYGVKLPYERKIIIDDDLDEIMI